MNSKRTISYSLQMNDGHSIPQLGLGTYQSQTDIEIMNAVTIALNRGYRHIDTAEMYKNEELVGEGMRNSGVPRVDIFITSKVWPSNFGFQKTTTACKKSLIRLGVDYLDLYLLHWPQEKNHLESWQALIQLQKEGLVRSIGVSNFSIDQISRLAKDSGRLPAVNQVELSPFNYTKDLLDYCQNLNIIIEAYAPLTRGRKLSNQTISNIAVKYNKTNAQILLRWALQHDVVAIPKSKQRLRINENADLFDFNISIEDMKKIDQLDEGFRTC